MAQVIYANGAIEDLARLEEFSGGVVDLIVEAVEMLASHPLLGRDVGELRELVVSRGRTGYVALYHFDEVADVVFVLALRHQRELRY